MKNRIYKTCLFTFILSVTSFQSYSQKTPDDLGKIIYQSFKDQQPESLDRYCITLSHLTDFLTENKLSNGAPTKEVFDNGVLKFKEKLNSIYQQGKQEGINWSAVELVSVESE